MQDERDEIRARVDIVDLVGQRVLLKRAGKHWKGLCPFHDDRNPSFVVNADIGRYRCWSCGESGDVFNWVMKTQNVDFSEALRLLADKAGIQLKAYRGDGTVDRKQRLELMKLAQEYFVSELEKSKAALKYCEGRDLSEPVRKEWGIGLAPESDHGMASHLRKAKASLAVAKELFLVEDDGTGAYFDKFRGRLMFPIHDERGDLIAYGGRVLGDGHPKYVNSSDTPLYRKSRVLYGMHRAKESIAKERRAVLVEGYLDVIACHRAGITNAVASLGTSLAEDHAKLLHRWCETVTILYDSDSAGIKAASRASDILSAEGLSVRVALLPQGQDPDTMLRDLGAGAVRDSVDQGVSPSEFRLGQLEAEFEPGSEAYWASVTEALAMSPTISEMQRLAGIVAAKHLTGSKADAEQLLQRARQLKKSQQSARRKSQQEPAHAVVSMEVGRCTPSEQRLFLAFLESTLRHEVLSFLRRQPLLSAPGQATALAILEAFPDSPPTGKPIEWLSKIACSEAQEVLADCMVRSEDADLLVRSGKGEVTSGELADVFHDIMVSADRRAVAETLANNPSADDLQSAFARLAAQHERESSLWNF